MRRSLASLDRLQRVQSQMKRLSEWRLAELDRRKRMLTDNIADLHAMLDAKLDAAVSDHGLLDHGLLIDLVDRRAHALGRERDAVTIGAKLEADRLTAKTRLAGMLDRALAAGRDDARRAQEAGELVLLIERLGAGPSGP